MPKGKGCGLHFYLIFMTFCCTYLLVCFLRLTKVLFVFFSWCHPQPFAHCIYSWCLLSTQHSPLPSSFILAEHWLYLSNSRGHLDLFFKSLNALYSLMTVIGQWWECKQSWYNQKKETTCMFEGGEGRSLSLYFAKHESKNTWLWLTLAAILHIKLSWELFKNTNVQASP